MLYSMTTLWAKYQYAKCFGNWLVSDPECRKCAVKDECEKRTKSRVEDKTKESQDSEVEENGEVDPTLAPLDYILQSLSGKYDQEFEETDKKIKLYKFFKDGKKVVSLGISESGQKIVVAVIGNKKVFDSPTTIEEAEALMTEMLS